MKLTESELWTEAKDLAVLVCSNVKVHQYTVSPGIIEQLVDCVVTLSTDIAWEIDGSEDSCEGLQKVACGRLAQIMTLAAMAHELGDISAEVFGHIKDRAERIYGLIGS